MAAKIGLGRLREVIVIDREVPQVDGAELEPSWVELGRLRAAPQPVRASEGEREGAVRTIQVYLFTVIAADLRRLAPTTRDRLRWNGWEFNIREIRLAVTSEPMTEIVAETGVTL